MRIGSMCLAVKQNQIQYVADGEVVVNSPAKETLSLCLPFLIEKSPDIVRRSGGAFMFRSMGCC
jgi:hypothetical protein